MNNAEFNKSIREKHGGDVYDISIPLLNLSKKEGKGNVFIKIISGAFIGFINGFWGGGGGMLCVPVLLNIIKLPEKKAHATTLLIMLPLSLASLVVYYFSKNLPLIESFKIGIGFVIGGTIGALLLKKISNVWLEIIFSVIIIAGGIKLLI